MLIVNKRGIDKSTG